MLAVDTCSYIAFTQTPQSPDSQLVRRALERNDLIYPPVVIAELFSDRKLKPEMAGFLECAPIIPIGEGYWRRTGLMRSALLKKGYKARIADVLIAQSCIDHNAALVTRDKDFRHFVPFGLELAL